VISPRALTIAIACGLGAGVLTGLVVQRDTATNLKTTDPSAQRVEVAPVQRRAPIAAVRRTRKAPVPTVIPKGTTKDTETQAKPAASLSRGVDARLKGDLKTAAAVLAEYIAANPGASDVFHARVLLGVVLSDMKRFDEAAQVFKDIYEAGGPPMSLSDLSAMHYGEALRATKKPQAAMRYFSQVADMYRSPHAPRATFRVADAHFEAGNCPRALQLYNRALKAYPQYPDRLQVRLRNAICLAQTRRVNEAAKAFQWLTVEIPNTPTGKTAAKHLAKLKKKGAKVPKLSFAELYRWGRTLRLQRRWAAAVAVLKPLVKKAPNRKWRAKVLTDLARAQESLQQYDDALKTIDKARKSGGRTRELLYCKSRILRKQGQFKNGIRLLRRLTRTAVERDRVTAKAYAEDGFYKLAGRLYRKRYKPEQGVEMAWTIAWMDYRSGKLSRARRALKTLLRKRAMLPNRLRYWIARMDAKRGKKKAALSRYEFLAKNSPRNYYGIQAANRILELGETDLYLKVTGAKKEHLPTKEALKTNKAVIHWQGANGSALPKQARAARQNAVFRTIAEKHGGAFPELWRAFDRYRLGLDEQAVLELRIAAAEFYRSRRGSARHLANRPLSLYVDNRNRKRGVWGCSVNRSLGLSGENKRKATDRIQKVKKTSREFLHDLGTLFVALGDPWGSRRAVLNKGESQIRGLPTDANRSTFKQAFPLVYEDILRKETSKYGQSLYLMSALTRVESAFNTLAVSVAGARGLLQVMPVTGRLIAGRRGDTDFATASLLDPRVSIAYGTWYMDQILKKFGGQEPLAIPSYNAGPHRMHQWVLRRGEKSHLDEFIEEIPYSEARNYVKKVLTFVALYRRIYEDRPDMYVGQVIDTTCGDNINW
jgi:tetratricopeptide (TPR) repeat protein